MVQENERIIKGRLPRSGTLIRDSEVIKFGSHLDEIAAKKLAIIHQIAKHALGGKIEVVQLDAVPSSEISHPAIRKGPGLFVLRRKSVPLDALTQSVHDRKNAGAVQKAADYRAFQARFSPEFRKEVKTLLKRAGIQGKDIAEFNFATSASGRPVLFEVVGDIEGSLSPTADVVRHFTPEVAHAIIKLHEQAKQLGNSKAGKTGVKK